MLIRRGTQPAWVAYWLWSFGTRNQRVYKLMTFQTSHAERMGYDW